MDESNSYEHFVQDVRRDFEDRVYSVQKTTQEAIKVYEAYCVELKTELEEKQLENEILKRRLLVNGDDPVLDLLSAMTSLSIQSIFGTDTLQRYSCKVVDGLLAGHTFLLTLDHHAKEYTYDPERSPLKKLKHDFSAKFCFPDHMLSRFLINLLHVTHKI